VIGSERTIDNHDIAQRSQQSFVLIQSVVKYIAMFQGQILYSTREAGGTVKRHGH